MSRTARFITCLCCLVLAIGVNLVACRWGTSVTGTTVLSIHSQVDSGQTKTFGLVAAPWLAGKQLAATLLGIVLPMGLLGLGTYCFIRKSGAEAPSQP